MKFFHSRFLAAIALLLLSAVCHASLSAVVIIYQPIMTEGDAIVIETPKGFAVMPIPFESFPHHGPPYQAIAQANPLLTNSPTTRPVGDANLVSLSGVTIETSVDDNIVHVHFEALTVPEGYDEITADDVAEATIECIRRMARGEKKRPTLKITGKKGEEAKWLRWQEQFRKHDLAKLFKKPRA